MFHRSQVFLIILLGFLTGVLARSFFIWPAIVSIAALFTCGAISFLSKRWARAAAVIVCAGGFGAIYFSLRLPVIDSRQISHYAGTDVVIEARVISPPEEKNGKNQLDLAVISFQDSQPVSGKVRVNLSRFVEVGYGDNLTLSCDLKKPEPISDFRYDRYLAVSGIYVLCQKPEIKSIEKSRHSFSIKRTLYQIAYTAKKLVGHIFPEPEASFLTGLLLGGRGNIPAELSEKFQKVGLSHVVAISGYNITIIATLIESLTSQFIGRKRSFWLIILVLACFVVITGGQASVIRAGIMGVVVLLARMAGRMSLGGSVLLFAAAIMVLVNPLVLAFDLGFQLSFLATAGLLYLAQLLDRLFKWLPQVFGLRESLVTTLSATIMTLPLITYHFGRVSLVAPLANLAILPLIPLIMATGFISLIAGLIFVQLSQVLSVLPWLLLKYCLAVVDWLSAWTNASLEGLHLPIAIVWLFYLLIAAVCFWTRRRWQKA